MNRIALALLFLVLFVSAPAIANAATADHPHHHSSHHTRHHRQHAPAHKTTHHP